MNNLIKIKRKKLALEEEHLQNLSTEYDEILKPRAWVKGNEITKIELEAQNKWEKMEKSAIQCDKLRTEIWDELARSELKSLLNILAMIDEEIILKAYQSCLPGRIDLEKHDLREKLLRLDEIPDNPTRLFISYIIIDCRLPVKSKLSLKEWLIDKGWESIRILPMETYLMIKVEPKSPTSGVYFISAAIAEDRHSLKPEYSEYDNVLYLLESDQSSSTTYSKEDLPSVVCKLINSCIKDHGIARSKLIVQWFLPISLMNLPIENWQISVGGGSRYISQLCKAVIVCIYDRHFFSCYETALPDWKKYWEILCSDPNICCAETLYELSLIDGRQIIDRGNQKLVGCRFIEIDDQQSNVDFWDVILAQGLPIGLWLRQSKTNIQNDENEMKLVLGNKIGDLPVSLTTHRGGQQSGVGNLSLLWDNPFRTFPKPATSKSKNTKVV
jgi:vWA-MoxR associated protein C-terminal domain